MKLISVNKILDGNIQNFEGGYDLWSEVERRLRGLVSPSLEYDVEEGISSEIDEVAYLLNLRDYEPD